MSLKVIWGIIVIMVLSELVWSVYSKFMFNDSYARLYEVTYKKAAKHGSSILLCVFVYAVILYYKDNFFPYCGIDLALLSLIVLTVGIITRPKRKRDQKYGVTKQLISTIQADNIEVAFILSKTPEMFRRTIETLLHMTRICTLWLLLLFSVVIGLSFVYNFADYIEIPVICTRVALFLHAASAAVYLICIINSSISGESINSNEKLTYESVLKKFESREHPI